MVLETTKDGQVIVTGAQEIDISNVSEFESSLDEAAAKSPHGFIVDLTGTSYIDSAGVQAILGAYVKEHSEDRKLAIVTSSSLIRNVLGVVHLEQLPGVHLFEDPQAAKELLSQRKQ